MRERAIAVAASAESRLMEGLVGGGWERQGSGKPVLLYLLCSTP